jgi:hypothetical protein
MVMPSRKPKLSTAYRVLELLKIAKPQWFARKLEK